MSQKCGCLAAADGDRSCFFFFSLSILLFVVGLTQIQLNCLLRHSAEEGEGMWSCKLWCALSHPKIGDQWKCNAVQRLFQQAITQQTPQRLRYPYLALSLCTCLQYSYTHIFSGTGQREVDCYCRWSARVRREREKAKEFEGGQSN